MTDYQHQLSPPQTCSMGMLLGMMACCWRAEEQGKQQEQQQEQQLGQGAEGQWKPLRPPMTLEELELLVKDEEKAMSRR